MHIHLFGHSICRSSKGELQPTETFVDILEKKYNLSETDTFTVMQSDSITEERILYFLKKLRKIDIIIIFHQAADAIFVPSSKHDFPILSPKNRKDTHHRYNGEVEYHKHVLEDKSTPNIYTRNGEEFQSAINGYLDFLHTRDLNRNRLRGAISQIDQYINYKGIKAIHCLYNESNFPLTWFNFTSGIIDIELARLQDKGQYVCSHNESINRINTDGNNYIADKLSRYIDNFLAESKGFEPLSPFRTNYLSRVAT